jgi:hypothetical protein
MRSADRTTRLMRDNCSQSSAMGADVDIAGCCSVENKGVIVRSVLSSPPAKLTDAWYPCASSRVALHKGVKSKKQKTKKTKILTTGAACLRGE